MGTHSPSPSRMIRVEGHPARRSSCAEPRPSFAVALPIPPLRIAPGSTDRVRLDHFLLDMRKRLLHYRVVDDDIKKYLADIGRRGGLKGGKARAENMTPKERSAAAKKAAEARWGKPKGKKGTGK